jgi:hypothetical protein
MHFAGKRAPTGDPLRSGAPAGRAIIWRLEGHSSSGKHGSSSADYGEGGGCTVTGWLRRWRGGNRSGCRHTFVGARLPANALGQSMHQGLAKCISRASSLPQGRCLLRDSAASRRRRISYTRSVALSGSSRVRPRSRPGATTVVTNRCEWAGKGSVCAYHT